MQEYPYWPLKYNLTTSNNNKINNPQTFLIMSSIAFGWAIGFISYVTLYGCLSWIFCWFSFNLRSEILELCNTIFNPKLLEYVIALEISSDHYSDVVVNWPRPDLFLDTCTITKIWFFNTKTPTEFYLLYNIRFQDQNWIKGEGERGKKGCVGR